jgi:asparagine synthase (glutamine-hydrolysing)
MCGLAGFVTSGRPIPDPEGLGCCLGRSLAHRGPDGGGTWTSASRDVVLTHRRLAIIDLSANGRQPMATPDGRHQVVFNGEVYNYRELRHDLESRGERFTTASDTEVLLRVIVRDGPAALARVRGMFALAVWDTVDHSLLLARDRFGIKPLYVAISHSSVAFASEIRSLLVSGLVAREVEPAGVLGYLAWGSVPPPLTWIAGVESLTPGTWLRWSATGRCERSGFADIGAVYARCADGATSPRTLRLRARAAVQDSVAAHLVADVPVGIFLSGGIDSSAILSAAVSAGATGLHTYTVRFEGAGSEHEYARLVASTFGATHHELVVDGSHVVADLPGILDRLDQPTIDGVNSFYVSRAVAATGVKAVLSGTGGDELFGGYPSFRRLPPAARIRRGLGPVFPWLAPAVAAGLPARLAPRWHQFASGDERIESAYRAQRGLFMPAELRHIAGPALRDGAVAHAAAERLAAAESALFAAPSRAGTLAGDVARLETRAYLGAQLLRDLDAMSMAHSLEVRVPFVDHVLLDAVWPELGRHTALIRNKRLLHETLVRPLPPEAVNRPKQGFVLPFAKWIGGELQPFVDSGMAYLSEAGWIAPDAAGATWRAWQRGAAHWSRVWALGVLGEFLRGV